MSTPRIETSEAEPGSAPGDEPEASDMPRAGDRAEERIEAVAAEPAYLLLLQEVRSCLE